MKRKITITFLISLLVLMFSMSALAVEVDVDYDMMPKYSGSDDIMLIDDFPTTDIAPASNTIKVQLDGNYVDFTDENGNVVNPEMMNNRTMVPMRKIFEELNATVDWNNETKTVVGTTDTKQITLTINNNVALIKDLVTNEEQSIELDAAPTILNNRTMVPVRVIAEGLEKEVGWDSANRTVIIIDFDKIEAELAEKLPILQQLFEIEMEPVTSFKTTSDVKGKIVYTDAEATENNETLNFDGTLKLNLNEAKDLEMYFDVDFEGKGQIYTSLKQAGYEKLSMGMIFKGETSYMMLKQDGEEVWTELGQNVDLSSIFEEFGEIKFETYYDVVEFLKTSMGELNSESYNDLQQAIDLLAVIYNENTIKITETSSKKTIKMTIDMQEMLGGVLGSTEDFSEIFGDSKLRVETTRVINKGKVESEKVSFEMYIEEPSENAESMELTMDLDMDYTSVNKDFDIKTPAIAYN